MLKPVITAYQLAPNREHLLHSVGMAEALNTNYSDVAIRMTGAHLSLPSDRSAEYVMHVLPLPSYGVFLNEGRKEDDYIHLELDFSGRSFLDTLKVKWDNYFVYLSFLGVLSLHTVRGGISLKTSGVKLVRLSDLAERHVNIHYGPGLAIANLMATGEVMGYDLEFKALNQPPQE